MRKTATISQCGFYRYSLARQWAAGNAIATFIMLNPSTADAEKDDPTIRRCIAFARTWGCDGLRVLNLFALRTPSPKEMMAANDPIGPDNIDAFRSILSDDGPVVCAWGNHGSFMNQAEHVLGWIEHLNPKCLGLTNSGQPKHPLSRGKGFIPYSQPLLPYPAATEQEPR